jgi:hypothetical protein
MQGVPSSGDQPPRNEDTPPRNAADQPPRNAADAPSDSGGANPPPPSGGGSFKALCQQLCSRISDCPDADGGDLCDADCELTPLQESVIAPCQGQINALYSCALSLPDVCAAEEIEDTPCEASAAAFEECAEGLGSVDNGGNGGGSCSGPNNCASCATLCQTCTCAGGTADDCAAICASGM